MSTKTETREPAVGQRWRDRDSRLPRGKTGERIIQIMEIKESWPNHVFARTVVDGSPKGPLVKILKRRLARRFTPTEF
jgi:hypothetical protein